MQNCGYNLFLSSVSVCVVSSVRCWFHRRRPYDPIVSIQRLTLAAGGWDEITSVIRISSKPRKCLKTQRVPVGPVDAGLAGLILLKHHQSALALLVDKLIERQQYFQNSEQHDKNPYLETRNYHTSKRMDVTNQR